MRRTGTAVPDEGADVAAVLAAIGEAAFLLGHSYGGQVALAAAARAPKRVTGSSVRCDEAPWPTALDAKAVERLEAFGRAGEWDTLATTVLPGRSRACPRRTLDDLRSSPLWPPIVADAKASLGDLRALLRYEFVAERFRMITCPVLLQVGTESPRHLYVTDALAGVLSDARIEELPGQAHEANDRQRRRCTRQRSAILLGNRRLCRLRLLASRSDARARTFATRACSPSRAARFD